MSDVNLLSDMRCLFMGKLDNALTTARCAHKEMETLYKELSDEMIDSEVGFNLRCDLEELWSYIINAQGAAKMLRLNLERGHDSC
tara:strand:+ start:176 stop:430 length:255 start_codon:yes stop_codon:yes gene_type:complete